MISIWGSQKERRRRRSTRDPKEDTFATASAVYPLLGGVIIMKLSLPMRRERRVRVQKVHLSLSVGGGGGGGCPEGGNDTFLPPPPPLFELGEKGQHEERD